MWATPTKSFKEFGGTGATTAPARFLAKFNRALIRAKMFDTLIGNMGCRAGHAGDRKAKWRARHGAAV